MRDDPHDEFAFGPFRFTIDDRQLIRDDAPVHLTPKTADLLLALLQNAGRVVSKDALLERVWPDASVAEGTIAYHIHMLRDALGDGKEGQKYVENLPRRGYRFVAPVSVTSSPLPQLRGENSHVVRAAGTALPATPDAHRQAVPIIERRSTRRIIATVGVVGAVLLGVLAAFPSRAPSPPRVARYTQVRLDRASRLIQPPLLTDGANLYFDSHGSLTAVPVVGGEPRAVGALQGFKVFDVSPGGTSFLATRYRDPGADKGLWVVATDGTSRRVGEVMVDADAAWSPDARRIAYPYEGSVYVADSDGGNASKLVTTNGAPVLLRWSPDGQLLRFTVDVRADRDVSHSLWQVNADGTGLRRFDRWDDHTDVCCGDWTSDGRYFVFQVGGNPARSSLWVLDERHGDRSLSLEPTQLTDGPLSFMAPAPSGNPNTIFALGVREHGELVRYDSRVRDFVPYLAGMSALWVGFSRDRAWVAYASHPESVLWRARVDGRDKRQLTSPPMQVDGAAWSPDGSSIAFRGRMPGGVAKIYIVPAAGGAAQPLTSDDVEQGMPTWSADGTRLAFGDVPEQFGRPTGSEVIHIYDLATRAVTAVPGSQGLWTSRWSPDGRSLAALTIRGQQVKVFDFSSEQWRALPADHVNNPNWTRDSAFIYYDTEGDDRAVRRVRVSDGVVEDVVDLKGYPTTTSWWSGLSLDDEPILLKAPGGVQIYALDLKP